MCTTFMVASPKYKEPPLQPPKHYNPHSWDFQNVTQILGNPPCLKGLQDTSQNSKPQNHTAFGLCPDDKIINIPAYLAKKQPHMEGIPKRMGQNKNPKIQQWRPPPPPPKKRGPYLCSLPTLKPKSYVPEPSTLPPVGRELETASSSMSSSSSDKVCTVEGLEFRVQGFRLWLWLPGA